MVFGAAVWVLMNSIDYIFENTILTKCTYLGAILIAIGFYYFSFYFPYLHKRIKRVYSYLIMIMGIILIVSLFIDEIFIEEILYKNDYAKILGGPLFHVFNVYFLILWAWGIFNLISKYKRADGLHRWQIKNTFYAISVSLVAGITTNLFMPWFGIWTLGWIGPLFSIIFFGFLSYILFKREA